MVKRFKHKITGNIAEETTSKKIIKYQNLEILQYLNGLLKILTIGKK